MIETRILIWLLWMYFPRNWEFGSALSKLLNFFGGEGGSPPWYATDGSGRPEYNYRFVERGDWGEGQLATNLFQVGV
jgi:hypothetical protein